MERGRLERLPRSIISRKLIIPDISFRIALSLSKVERSPTAVAIDSHSAKFCRFGNPTIVFIL
jgi:hypothetical protein